MIGISIGPYKIMCVLGQGGMATVYKAYDSKLNRKVAIKIIRKDAFTDEVQQRILKRFDLESKVLARLSHDNIVKMFEFGHYQGSPYMVMEYVNGKTLKEFPKPINHNLAIDLIIYIANALNHAHSKKILHRDIKPSNILITSAGIPKLADFGIAKLLEGVDGQTLTATGAGIGTPEYMAPEQGLGKEIDGRADVYSLGIVLFELVTGNKPFSADTPVAIMMKHINNPIPKLTEINPDLPYHLEIIINKALAKDPNERYSDMDAFKSDLHQIQDTTYDSELPLNEILTQLDFDKVHYRPHNNSDAGFVDYPSENMYTDRTSSSHTAKVSKKPLRFSIYSFGIIIVGLMLIVGLLLIFKSLQPSSNFPQTNVDNQATEIKTIYSSNEDLQFPTENSELVSQNIIPEKVSYPPDVIQINNVLELSEINKWQAYYNYLSSVSWMKDSKSFIISDMGYGFEQYDISSFKSTPFKEEMVNIYMAGFSPDALAYITRNRDATQYDVWDFENDYIKYSIQGNVGYEMTNPKISPDGKTVVGLMDNALRLWDAENGQSLFTLDENLSNDPWNGTYDLFAFSPDSKTLAAGIALTGEITIWDVASGNQISTIQWHEYLKSISFSPDGNVLASGSNNVKNRDFIRFWDVSTGELISTIQKSNEGATSLEFTIDGETIISGSSTGTIRIWRVSDSSLLRTLFSSDGEISSLSISHDGKHLVSVGSEVILWGIKN